MNMWRNPKRGASAPKLTLGVCHFEGCDEDAPVTVGVTPLCELHQGFILDLLDAGTAAVPEPSFAPGSAN